MNSKERFEIAAKRGTPDRVPVVYYGFGGGNHILRHLQLSWQDLYWNAGHIAKAMLKSYEFWKHDNVCSFLTPTCGIDALVSIKSPISPYVEREIPVLRTEEGLRKLRVPDPKKDGSMKVRVEAARILKEKVGNRLAILGGFGGISTWATLLRGTDKFLRDTMKNPDFQKGYMEFLTECAIEYCTAQVEAGCDWIISAEDLFALNLLGPHKAWEVNGVYVKRLAKSIRDAGAGYILHCCGEADPSLISMTKTGADVLSLEKVDLKEAKEKVGDKVGLMGNVSLNELFSAPPEKVWLEGKKAIERAGKRGFLLSGGYIYPADTPPENILALVESARNGYIKNKKG